MKDKSSGGEVPLVYYPPIVVVFPIAGPIHISVMVIPTLTMDCNAHAKGTIGITLPMTFDSSLSWVLPMQETEAGSFIKNTTIRLTAM